MLKYLPTNLSRPEIEGELSVSVNTVSTHLRSICMAFTALDALREGYEVYLVVDAIGGTSPEAHRVGLDRVMQAGGQPISWVSLACELQRDWARQDTAAAIIEIVLTDRLLKEQ